MHASARNWIVTQLRFLRHQLIWNNKSQDWTACFFQKPRSNLVTSSKNGHYSKMDHTWLVEIPSAFVMICVLLGVTGFRKSVMQH